MIRIVLRGLNSSIRVHGTPGSKAPGNCPHQNSSKPYISLLNTYHSSSCSLTPLAPCCTPCYLNPPRENSFNPRLQRLPQSDSPGDPSQPAPFISFLPPPICGNCDNSFMSSPSPLICDPYNPPTLPLPPPPVFGPSSPSCIACPSPPSCRFFCKKSCCDHYCNNNSCCQSCFPGCPCGPACANNLTSGPYSSFSPPYFTPPFSPPPICPPVVDDIAPDKTFGSTVPCPPIVESFTTSSPSPSVSSSPLPPSTLYFTPPTKTPGPSLPPEYFCSDEYPCSPCYPITPQCTAPSTTPLEVPDKCAQCGCFQPCQPNKERRTTPARAKLPPFPSTRNLQKPAESYCVPRSNRSEPKVPSSDITPFSRHTVLISDCKIFLCKSNKCEPLKCEADSIIIFKRTREGVPLENEIKAVTSENCKPKTLRDFTDPFYSPIEDILLAPVHSDGSSLVRDLDTQQKYYDLRAATPVPSNRCPRGRKYACLDWPRELQFSKYHVEIRSVERNFVMCFGLCSHNSMFLFFGVIVLGDKNNVSPIRHSITSENLCRYCNVSFSTGKM